MNMDLTKAEGNPIQDIEQALDAMKKTGIEGIACTFLAGNGVGYTVIYGNVAAAINVLNQQVGNYVPSSPLIIPGRG